MARRTPVLAAVFCLLFVSVPRAHTASLEDIIGIWSATYHPSLKVSGYLKKKSVSYGEVHFYNSMQLIALENDNGTLREYWGEFLILDGKKIVVEMSLSDFLDTIKAWIQEKADDTGHTVTDIVFEVVSFKVSPCKINQRKMSLGKMKVSIKGTVSAHFNGVYQTNRLSYKSLVVFGPKISDLPG